MDTKQLLTAIVDNIEQVIVGKREIVEKVVMALIADGHILIEDVPGVGKTSLVAALSKTLNCSFNRIQFTADIMPSDITGFSVYNQKSGSFDFKPGAVMSQFVLADEINRASPKTQASLLEAMEERQVTVDGKTYQLKKPFMVLATQNPIDYLGTYPLPEAQLDRFFMKISIGYPSPKQERRILERFSKGSPLAEVKPIADGEDVLRLQQEVKKVFVHPAISEYIVSLVNATRNSKKIVLGGSPRASLALFRASQARAMMQGRDFVVPDDVKYIAGDVLAHRIVLRHEYRGEVNANEAVIAELLERVAIPQVEKKAEKRVEKR